MYIDEKGNVQYKDEVLFPTIKSDENSQALDPPDEDVYFFNKDDFNLGSSVYNSFLQVRLNNYSYLNDESHSIDNLFLTERANQLD